MDYNKWILEVKELTEGEYLKAEEDAKELIRKRNGEQPTLEQFRNKVGGQFNIIVALMLIAFIGALIISTFDISKFVGSQVFEHYSKIAGGYIGIPIDPFVQSVFFQVSFVLLAEFSVILFLTRWRQEVKANEFEHFYIWNFIINKNVVKFIMQFFNIYFVLAVASISFVFYANWQSGVHWLLAVLPPIVTLGVGWVFEELITDWLAQKEKDTKQFIEASNEWLLINREPETHSQYKEMLMRSIWNHIKRKNSKYEYGFDVEANWKIQAVNRELEKASWAKNALVVKQYQYEHPDKKDEDIKNMSNLEILRDKLNDWVKGDKPVIEVGEYVVDMRKLTIKNTITNVIESSNTIRGLKHKVTSKIKESKNV